MFVGTLVFDKFEKIDKINKAFHALLTKYFTNEDKLFGQSCALSSYWELMSFDICLLYKST